MSKFASRKFILASAGFLSGFGAGVVGIVIGDTDLSKVGAVCMAGRAGLYSAAEAYVDGQAVASSTTNTTTTLQATTSSKEIADKVLGGPNE